MLEILISAVYFIRVSIEILKDNRVVEIGGAYDPSIMWPKEDSHDLQISDIDTSRFLIVVKKFSPQARTVSLGEPINLCPGKSSTNSNALTCCNLHNICCQDMVEVSCVFLYSYRLSIRCTESVTVFYKETKFFCKWCQCQYPHTILIHINDERANKRTTYHFEWLVCISICVLVPNVFLYWFAPKLWLIHCSFLYLCMQVMDMYTEFCDYFWSNFEIIFTIRALQYVTAPIE